MATTMNESGLILPDGTTQTTAINSLSDLSVTATATELNLLDGVTASTAEINKLDGVTSSIQTQLDAKLASSSYTAADVLTKIKTVDGSGSGLDADTVDGRTWSSTRNSANTLVTRDANGYCQLGWINTTSGATTSTINKIYASYDGYVRYVTPATLISQLDLATESYVDTAVAGAIGTTFPFYKEDGTSDTIAITNGSFPFYKENGTQDNIGVS